MSGSNKKISGIKSGIARKLIVSIIICSLLVTAAMTTLLLYRDYRDELKSLDSKLREIETARLPGIINSMWTTDHELTENYLKGLLYIPDIEYLAISSDGANIITAGNIKSEDTVSRDYPLSYVFKGRKINLGTLHVTAGLDGVRERVMHNGINILLHEFIEVFILASFLILFFYFFAGRHLTYMSEYTKKLSYENLDRPLVLKRSGKKPDELDQLALSINSMRENMAGDIAARMEAEKDLRLFRSLIDQSSEAVFIIEPETGRILDFNPTVCRTLGYDCDDMLNMKVTDFEVSLPDTFSWKKHVAELRERGTLILEGMHRKKDGSRFPVEINVKYIRAEDNDYILAMVRDITERKKAEDNLGKSEEKYRRIIESLRKDYFFYSHDTNGVFTYISPSISNVLGYTPEEFLTHYTEYLTGNPVNREVERHTQQSIKGILQEPYELEIYHKDGGIRWLDITEVPVFNDEGKVITVEGIAHDITAGKIADEQKRRLEEHLRQAQKIEAVGILAGGIAHDFNNILNAIMGFTYLARLKTPEGSEAITYLDRLMEAANRAAELVRQILAFSSKGAGELQPVIIAPVVKEALNMLRASIPTTIEIRQHIVSANYILGDPTQIHQIIMNLCTNAYHAMQDTGGVMEVRVEDMDIGPDIESLIVDIKQGPHVRLTVSDTGKGIDPLIIDKIFDPYFTTKGMGKGTGLGLSVVHGIVKQCGGSITVSSELNNGSSFQVFFPVVHLEARGESRAGEALMTGTETVLLVDDEESIVIITGEILKGLGYNVVSSTNSEEALRLFREAPGRFDLVFTDMTMPRMTGFQLSNSILGIRPDVPIILSTGHSEDINEEIVKKSGIRGLLIKPVSPEKLSRAIRRALEK